MNKIKTTKREMKENFRIIGIQNCAAQRLLSQFSPIAYSAGGDGWSCDYYCINDVIISTGYGYIENKRTEYDYKDLRKAEEKARKIYHNWESKLTYKQKDAKVKRILIKFINDSISKYVEESNK